MEQPNKFETVSIVACPESVVAVVKYQMRFRAQPQWFVAALAVGNGRVLFQHELHTEPLPGGLLIDKDGQIIVGAS